MSDSTRPASALLALLERVAEGGDLDDQVAELVSAAERPRIREALRRVGAGAARARSRELEFAALSSTVRELAELRDLDALLTRIVERAHELMGADITHLSEFDEKTHGLAVRASAGLVSGTFQDVQVPPYSGLAGRVAESRTPLWTSSYTTDETFPRDPGLDAAVRAEGIVALLGVPLIAGRQVLGVLFAADRYQREFTRDDVALLAAFADAVAVVLQSARLLDHEQVAARQAEEARAALAAQVAGMERASRVHEELTAAVLRGADAAEVAAGLEAELGRSVTVLRWAGDAWVDRPDSPPIDDPALLSALGAGANTGRVTPAGDVAGLDAVVVVRAGETTPVALAVGPGPVPLGPVESRTLERGGQIVALLELQENAIAQATTRARDDLHADLLSPDPARRKGIGKRLRGHGLRADRLRTVVVVSVDASMRTEAAAAAGMVATVAAESGDAVVAVLPDDDPRAAAHTVADRIAATLGPRADPLLVVGSSPALHLDDLHRRLAESQACAEVLRALDVRGRVAVAADEYLPYTALFAHAPERVRSFLDLTLGPVSRWDVAHGTDLVETLTAYVRCNAGTARTARALDVHTNTVLLRLERITALLGERWREPDHFFRLSVATRLAGLAGQS